jgi:hypothetical protein
VLEFVRERGLVTRQQVLARFPDDDEAQVRSVLRDLCESQLVFSSGSSMHTSYRAASDEELATLQRARGPEGADELLAALMYREAPLTVKELAAKAQVDVPEVEVVVARLLASGRIQEVASEDEARYRVGGLVIPFGAAVGWEAAVFDHFKALVTTVLCKLDGQRAPERADVVGGSTYTIDVWEGHPLADEVYGALAKVRDLLGGIRARAQASNPSGAVPPRHTRVVIYAGQCLTQEGEPHD